MNVIDYLYRLGQDLLTLQGLMSLGILLIFVLIVYVLQKKKVGDPDEKNLGSDLPEHWYE